MSRILLTEKLVAYSKSQPNKPLYHWLDDAAAITKLITYEDLLISSQNISHYLLKNGVQPGDRVLLVYPPSLDFVVAFLGCLLAGVIAVPTFPPNPSKGNSDLEIFTSITASSGAKVALTSTAYNYATKVASVMKLLSFDVTTWPDLKWIVTDTLPNSSSNPPLPPVNPSNIAFLQYTSGSTSEPKGVMITHENLAHNLQLIITGLKATESTVVVSWLPQYHDMGLIGSFLGVIYCGGSGYYLSPLTFIRNPPVWIRAMSLYKATHMQAPNFAYSLTSRKFLALINSKATVNNAGKHAWVDDLDLSSVRHMINAAEPVEASSVDIFHAVFSKYGLPTNVIFPTYGLAEHTVYVCSNGQQRLAVDKNALEKENIVKVSNDKNNENIILMGCGKPSDSEGVDVRIVNPDTSAALTEDSVGEIWIKSKSSAQGYYRKEEITKSTFDGVICNDIDGGDIITTDGGYLRTGDLGFLHHGELFICGRQKDLIIIRGRNHYPQDIERTCESQLSSDLRGGCSAAFSASVHGVEGLVYVAEVVPTSTNLTQVIENIQNLIVQNHGIAPEVIVLIKSHTIPKTTSGKISRHRVRLGYLHGDLQIESMWHATKSLSSLDDDILESYVPAAASLSTADSGSEDGPIDPTGLSLSEVLPRLQSAVAECLASVNGTPSTDNSSNIRVDVPVYVLGLDSMSAVQLSGILERKFTVALPDELLLEPDATLTTMALSLIQGGVLKQRPVMYNSWEVLTEAIKREKTTKGKAKGILSTEWKRRFEIKAHVDTKKFEDGCALKLAPISFAEEMAYVVNFILFLILSFGATFAMLSVFLVFPFKIATAIFAVSLVAIFSCPDFWPIAFRTSTYYLVILKYLSYRVIMEAKIDPAIPTIYACAPHGVFAIPPILQAVVSEYIVGHNFNILGADVIFKIPGYNIFAKLSALKSVSRQSFLSLLNKGRSVAVIPGGIAEMFYAGHDSEEHIIAHKGFVRIALQTGSQIVPSYTFGHSQTLKTKRFETLEKISRAIRVSLVPFWGRWGLPVPNRVPLVTILGRPIPCPKVADPSPELIEQYFELYVREMQRIYERYKNVYNWHDPDRPLIIDRSINIS